MMTLSIETTPKLVTLTLRIEGVAMEDDGCRREDISTVPI